MLSIVSLKFTHSHENVIEYKESFIDLQTQTLCLVMEYAENGDI